MKATLIKLSLIAALSGAAATTAYAHPDTTEAGNHWVAHLSDSRSQPTQEQLARFGYETASKPAREITLSAGDRYLNVTQMETVHITAAGKHVTWTFDTLGTRPFALSEIIPGTEGVTVYVAPNPDYLG